MSTWPSCKAKKVFNALIRAGWEQKRCCGSHRILKHQHFPDFVFAFHDNQEIGPKMLARISKHTGLRPIDL